MLLMQRNPVGRWEFHITSIRRIGWLPLAAFRERFIPLRALGGEKKLSLGQVEHEQLRERLKDPRIHFAIVCASRSCPKLRGEAYRAIHPHRPAPRLVLARCS
jgi:hypothetical protein